MTATVSRVKTLVDEVRLASSQKAQGIGQVSQAIVQMEQVTQTTAATAEESAAASEELNAQAERPCTSWCAWRPSWMGLRRQAPRMRI